MRILHLNNRYWPTLGGAETWMGELSARFVAEGHQVTVLTTDALDYDLLWNPRRRRLAEREGQHRGVRILRFPVRHLPGSPYSYMGWRIVLRLASQARLVPVAWLARLARFTPWLPDLWRWLDRTPERFDLVGGVAVLYEPLIEAGLRFARRSRLPFAFCPLTHLGAGPRPGQDDMSRYYTLRHQLALARASDAVLAMTRAERDYLQSRGVPRERLHVVGAGVNPAEVAGGDGARFRARHNLPGPLVGFVSTMMPDKGCAHLVEAVRALWRAGRRLDLVLAGRRTRLFDQYLQGLPEADRARLKVLGPVSDEEKRDLLAAIDVYAMPSRSDSFGIIYLEAWLAGKPVIAARVWGMSDVVAEGEDGLLVPFGDVPALAQALADLLDQPQRRAALGEHGRRKVLNHYTWDQRFALVRDVYCRLAGAA